MHAHKQRVLLRRRGAWCQCEEHGQDAVKRNHLDKQDASSERDRQLTRTIVRLRPPTLTSGLGSSHSGNVSSACAGEMYSVPF